MIRSLRTDHRIFRQPSMRRHAPRDERYRTRYDHSFLPRRDTSVLYLKVSSHVQMIRRRILSDLADEIEHANHSKPLRDTSANDDHSPEEQPVFSGELRCSICQGTFRRPEHLKRHFRSHTKEKPFECVKCGRRFSRTYV